MELSFSDSRHDSVTIFKGAREAGVTVQWSAAGRGRPGRAVDRICSWALVAVAVSGRRGRRVVGNGSGMCW